jgi:hypothetical protein
MMSEEEARAFADLAAKVKALEDQVSSNRALIDDLGDELAWRLGGQIDELIRAIRDATDPSNPGGKPRGRHLRSASAADFISRHRPAAFGLLGFILACALGAALYLSREAQIIRPTDDHLTPTPSTAISRSVGPLRGPGVADRDHPDGGSGTLPGPHRPTPHRTHLRTPGPPIASPSPSPIPSPSVSPEATPTPSPSPSCTLPVPVPSVSLPPPLGGILPKPLPTCLLGG